MGNSDLRSKQIRLEGKIVRAVGETKGRSELDMIKIECIYMFEIVKK